MRCALLNGDLPEVVRASKGHSCRNVGHSRALQRLVQPTQPNDRGTAHDAPAARYVCVPKRIRIARRSFQDGSTSSVWIDVLEPLVLPRSFSCDVVSVMQHAADSVSYDNTFRATEGRANQQKISVGPRDDCGTHLELSGIRPIRRTGAGSNLNFSL